MENNNFHENTIPQPQLSSFSPVVPISVCYDSALLPAARNYAVPDYNRSVSHRELMKARIRQEMYAEMALEEELRREILMEKEFLTPKTMLPNHSYERVFNESNVSGSSGFVNNGVIETMPFQRDPRAMVPKVDTSVSQLAKDRLLLLPKKSNVSGKVRIGFANTEQTQTTRVKESATAGSAKTEKRDLRCFLCHVTATSAQALDDHIRGKKHQAKAKRLKGKHKANKKRRNNKKTRK